MAIFKKTHFLGVISLLVIACNSEYNTVGVDLISTDQFDTETREFPVFVSVDTLADLQSDQLTIAHLGNYDFSYFGRSKASITSQLSISTNPRFGRYSQEAEDEGDSTDPSVIDENERVTSVYLEIPFLINRNDKDGDGVIDAYDSDPTSADSDSDNDGVSDRLETQAGTNPLDQDSDGDGILDDTDTDNEAYQSENRVYEVDSIFGNRDQAVNIKVSELTYFLSNLDPNNNFETSSQYTSNQDFYVAGHSDAVLHNAPYQLNLEELRFNYAEDDPETTDVDETTQVETRLTPRLRIPLSTAFFQDKILDEEGQETLSTDENFREHFRGINIRIDDSASDIYMLLNLTGGVIKMNYAYNSLDDQGTDDTSDDVTEVVENTFNISLSGVKINHFNNQPSATQLPVSTQSNRIALKGALGSRARIRLFDQDDTTQILENFRSTNLLINEANLIFYIDPDLVNNWTAEDRIAERLFLYDLDSNLPLADYYSDPTSSAVPAENKIIHGGVLEYQDGVPYRYKFRLTEHISNLIRSDDEELSSNNTLGLAVSSNIANLGFRKATLGGNSNEITYPTAAFLNPLGTLLIGPNPSAENFDKRLKLEIIYTDFNN